ncbi:MAG: orotidine-5'-phosphate decarboxylase [Oscillatoriales cyanobacterium SM2_2_1]|nr:orotidine-5'-phosphate decarboxylase [Oscillatoriales cyanobacterium SM2_2_1]
MERNLNPHDRLIVALDVPSAAAALDLCDRLPATFYKIGLELYLAAGAGLIATLKQRQKRVFLDLKLHDIPNTVAAACRVIRDYDVDFVTVHGAGGAAMLTAAQEAIAAPRLLVVTVLTSITPAQLSEQLHIATPLGTYGQHLAEMAQNCGLAGAICSPQEAAALRRALGPDFLLVTPGIRPAGTDLGDQRRTLTPAEAIAQGADYLVIGRPITAAPDPLVAWEEMIAAMEG